MNTINSTNSCNLIHNRFFDEYFCFGDLCCIMVTLTRIVEEPGGTFVMQYSKRTPRVVACQRHKEMLIRKVKHWEDELKNTIAALSSDPPGMYPDDVDEVLCMYGPAIYGS
jgi:hypothetical protein